MAAHHPKTASLSSEERACRDSARPRQALPVPSPTFEEGESRSELAAQGHATGARLAGEADEQLVRGRRKAERRGRCDRTERPRPLQRHVGADLVRSEEHTSELQSLMRISYAVFCLKKKKIVCTKAQHNDINQILTCQAR